MGLSAVQQEVEEMCLRTLGMASLAAPSPFHHIAVAVIRLICKRLQDRLKNQVRASIFIIGSHQHRKLGVVAPLGLEARPVRPE